MTRGRCKPRPAPWQFVPDTAAGKRFFADEFRVQRYPVSALNLRAKFGEGRGIINISIWHGIHGASA